jgi:hypothetical protein
MRTTPAASPGSFTNHSINFGFTGEAVNTPTAQWNITTYLYSGTVSFWFDQSGAVAGYPNVVVAAGINCSTVFSFDAEL